LVLHCGVVVLPIAEGLSDTQTILGGAGHEEEFDPLAALLVVFDMAGLHLVLPGDFAVASHFPAPDNTKGATLFHR
jgi:hypothetical protein